MDDAQFRLFTKESLGRCQQQALAAAELAKQKAAAKEEEKDEDKPEPNPTLEAGKPLPKNYGDFPRELYGKPIEELDEFYAAKNVQCETDFTSKIVLSFAHFSLTVIKTCWLDFLLVKNLNKSWNYYFY